MTAYYKALRAGRRGTHTEFAWPDPGVWVHVEGELVACEHGLHVCRVDQLIDWLSDELWRVEVDESAGLLDAGDKVVARRVRLVEQVLDADRRLREFAADCAEHVLPIFEAVHPQDWRPRAAIKATRAYARGEIDSATAAGDAAWAAAGDAAWAAARDAARAAARAAAGDAAGDAARAAARAAAGDAAGAAVWAAAWDAAWAAAGAGEREWQTARLAHWLDVDL